jgi:hypothetical protein
MSNTDYPCDVCNEALARFWRDDKGAVCETCGRDDSPCNAEGDVVEYEDDDLPSTIDCYEDAEALASAGWGTDEDYGG